MWTVTQFLVTLLFVVALRLYLTSRKRWMQIFRLPGPTPLPIIGNLLEFAKFDYDVVKGLLSVAAQYNGFFRFYIGHQPVVLVSDPQHLKTYYTSTNIIDRSDEYRVFADFVGENLFVSGGSRWKKLRKMFVVNFSKTSLDVLKTNFLHVTEHDMLPAFRSRVDGPTFPCFKIFQTATTHSLFLNIIGKGIGAERQHKLQDDMDFFLSIAYRRNFHILWHFDLTFNLTTVGKEYWTRVASFKDCCRQIVLSAKEEIQEIKKQGKRVPNLYLFSLLENYSSESTETMTQEVATILVAGMDTTAGTMSFVMTVLGLFPEVQQKVYEEDQKVQQLLGGRQLEVEDLQHYSYLDRVIKETLRIFPIAPVLGRKVTEDTYFGKYLIPKGTDIAAIQIFTNHNPEWFPEPFKFDPERFLPENVDKMEPYAFNPFSAGPRGCPGMRYAYMVMKIMISSAVREFRIVSNYNTLQEALTNADAETTLRDKHGHPIRLLTRPKS